MVHVLHGWIIIKSNGEEDGKRYLCEGNWLLYYKQRDFATDIPKKTFIECYCQEHYRKANSR